MRNASRLTCTSWMARTSHCAMTPRNAVSLRFRVAGTPRSRALGFQVATLIAPKALKAPFDRRARSRRVGLGDGVFRILQSDAELLPPDDNVVVLLRSGDPRDAVPVHRHDSSSAQQSRSRRLGKWCGRRPQLLWGGVGGDVHLLVGSVGRQRDDAAPCA